MNTYGYVGGNPLSWFDYYGLDIGDLPPNPPGYNPDTWTHSTNSQGRDVVTNPDGNTWTTHPEDKGHWRHWDKQGPDGSKDGRWPSNSKKPWPNQKRPPYGDQSDKDPSGDEKPWQCPNPASGKKDKKGKGIGNARPIICFICDFIFFDPSQGYDPNATY